MSEPTSFREINSNIREQWEALIKDHPDYAQVLDLSTVQFRKWLILKLEVAERRTNILFKR